MIMNHVGIHNVIKVNWSLIWNLMGPISIEILLEIVTIVVDSIIGDEIIWVNILLW